MKNKNLIEDYSFQDIDFSNENVLVSGTTGSGKTNALLNMLIKEIDNEEGVLFIDNGGNGKTNYQDLLHNLKQQVIQKEINYINCANNEENQPLKLNLSMENIKEYLLSRTETNCNSTLKIENNLEYSFSRYVEYLFERVLEQIDFEFSFEDLLDFLSFRGELEDLGQRIYNEKVKRELNYYLRNWGETKKHFRVIKLELQYIESLLQKNIISETKGISLSELYSKNQKLYVDLETNFKPNQSKTLNKLIAIELNDLDFRKGGNLKIYVDIMDNIFNKYWLNLLSKQENFRLSFNSLGTLDNYQFGNYLKDKLISYCDINLFLKINKPQIAQWISNHLIPYTTNNTEKELVNPSFLLIGLNNMQGVLKTKNKINLVEIKDLKELN